MSQESKPRIKWEYSCWCSCDEYNERLLWHVVPQGESKPLIVYTCRKCGAEYSLTFNLHIGKYTPDGWKPIGDQGETYEIR